MPPIIALILCTSFVVFLLRLEKKQAFVVSAASWIPTIWMLYTASKPLGIWFRTVSENDIAGSPLDRVFLSALLCIGLVILGFRKGKWSRVIKEQSWMFLLISYMLVSIMWSDIPYTSFKRWIRELIAVVMALLILTERDPRTAVLSVLRRSIYILIPFSVLLVKYYPEYGVQFARWSGQRMWIGVATQKNGLGRLCLISTFFLIWMLIRRWQRHDIPAYKFQTFIEVIVLIITLWLLRGPEGSYPATAIVALLAGLAGYIGLLLAKRFRVRLGRYLILSLIICGIVFGIVTVFVSGTTVGSFASILGRDTTLTGRVGVWAALIPIVLQRPLVGSGFGGFWTDAIRGVYDISEGHSGYLDVLLELGFLGLFLFAMFLLSSCRKAVAELDHDFDWASLWICFLLIAVIHNVTESSINTLTSQMTAVILFLTVSSRAVAKGE